MHITLDFALDFFSLDRGFTQANLTRIYRCLCLQWHPDKHKDDPSYTQRFQLLSSLYSALTEWKISGSFKDFLFKMDFPLHNNCANAHKPRPLKYPDSRLGPTRYPRSGFPLFDKALRIREQWEAWIRQLKLERDELLKDTSSLPYTHTPRHINTNIFPHWTKKGYDRDINTRVSIRKRKAESSTRKMKEFARRHTKLIGKLKNKKNEVADYL